VWFEDSQLCEAGARLIQVNIQTCLSYLDRASLEPCLMYLDPARLEKEETVAVRDQGSELPPLVEHILRFVYKVTCGLCGMMLPPQLALEHVPAPNTMNGVCPGTTQEGVQPALVGCLRDRSDVDLEAMAVGVRPMIEVLTVLGGWTIIAVREMNANLAKLEASKAVAGIPEGKARLLSSVLSAEAEAGLHAPGGLIEEMSAASALLWLSRFLRLWTRMWREPRPPTFAQALMAAYESSISPYHNWVLQRTFGIATAVVPSWSEAHDRLEEFDVRGEEGLLQNVAALEPVLDRIEGALRDWDMYDTRIIG